MKKKGSLNLSMNAIVILILAITLLGLGLSFMRGLFKQMEAKVGVAVSSTELVNPPTTDNPITVAPGTLSIRGGEDGSVTVAYMNNMNVDGDCNLDLYEGGTLACAAGGTGCAMTIKYSDAWLTMAEDQINTWTLAISPDTTVVAGTYLYSGQIVCEDDHDLGVGATVIGTFTKDFVVIVKP